LPFGEIGRADEVAAAIAVLASSDAVRAREVQEVHVDVREAEDPWHRTARSSGKRPGTQRRTDVARAPGAGDEPTAGRA
jgi:hypothetical protein